MPTSTKTTTTSSSSPPPKRRLRLSNTNTDTLCTDHDSNFFQKWMYRFNLWTGLYMLNPYERLAFHVVGWFSLIVSLLYFYVFWSGFVQGIRTGGSDVVIGGNSGLGGVGGTINPPVFEIPDIVPKVDVDGINANGVVGGGGGGGDTNDEQGVASSKIIDNDDMDEDKTDEIIDKENDEHRNPSNGDSNDQKLEQEEKTEL